MKGQRGRQGGTDSARRAKTTKAESPEEATGRKGRVVGEGGSRRAAAHAKGWQGQQRGHSRQQRLPQAQWRSDAGRQEPLKQMGWRETSTSRTTRRQPTCAKVAKPRRQECSWKCYCCCCYCCGRHCRACKGQTYYSRPVLAVVSIRCRARSGEASVPEHLTSDHRQYRRRGGLLCEATSRHRPT